MLYTLELMAQAVAGTPQEELPESVQQQLRGLTSLPREESPAMFNLSTSFDIAPETRWVQKHYD